MRMRIKSFIVTNTPILWLKMLESKSIFALFIHFVYKALKCWRCECSLCNSPTLTRSSLLLEFIRMFVVWMLMMVRDSLLVHILWYHQKLKWMVALNQNAPVNCININLISFHKYLHFSHFSTVSREWCFVFSQIHLTNAINYAYYFVVHKQIHTHTHPSQFRMCKCWILDFDVNSFCRRLFWNMFTVYTWALATSSLSLLQNETNPRTFYPANNELSLELLCTNYGLWLGFQFTKCTRNKWNEKPTLASKLIEITSIL